MPRLYAHDNTNNMDRFVSCDENGNLQTDIVSGTISLPTGSATAAKQDVGNSSLSSIDGKIKMPTTLDEDRLKTRRTYKWQTTTPMSAVTINASSAATSSVVDLSDRGGEDVHLYMTTTAVGAPNLTITIQHSPDNSNWYNDTDTIATNKATDYALLNPLSRYIKINASNLDSSNSDVTLVLGYYE